MKSFGAANWLLLWKLLERRSWPPERSRRLKTSESQNFDVILADVNLPDGNTVTSSVLSGINDSSPNIAPDGTLYLGMHGNRIIAFEGGGNALSPTSVWPRFRQGMNQEGRYTGFNPFVMEFFPSAVTADGVWYKLDWLGSGWLSGVYFPWVYHIEHEWVYCSGEGNTDSYWFYDQLIGWVYTSRDWGDTFYHQPTDVWYFYLAGSSLLNTEGGRWFYDFGAGEWFQ